jgi:hypothetical protein
MSAMFSLDEMKSILEENGFNLEDLAPTQDDTDEDDTDEEVEKDNFTPEEFDKACEDLGLENCGEESSDEDDFFQRLQL